MPWTLNKSGHNMYRINDATMFTLAMDNLFNVHNNPEM